MAAFPLPYPRVTMQPALATAFVLLFFVLNFVQERTLRRRAVDPRGTLPIARGPFALAKLSMVLAWLGIVAQAYMADLRVVALGTVIPWLAVSLEALALGLIALGYHALGDANQMGLAEHPARVRTSGVYRVSRNPIYVGFHALSLAATLYTANPVVLLFALTSVVLHHAIVRAEERHLEQALGAEYRAYRAQVRRYL